MKLWNEKRDDNIFKIKNKRNEYNEINEREKDWNKRWKRMYEWWK